MPLFVNSSPVRVVPMHPVPTVRREGELWEGMPLRTLYVRALSTCWPLNPLADSARQVIDTGLDETSCFFTNDEDGEEVDHGYYFEELFVGSSQSQLIYFPFFEGGDFTYDEDRRKVIAAWKPLSILPRRSPKISPESARGRPEVFYGNSPTDYPRSNDKVRGFVSSISTLGVVVGANRHPLAWCSDSIPAMVWYQLGAPLPSLVTGCNFMTASPRMGSLSSTHLQRISVFFLGCFLPLPPVPTGHSVH